MPDKKQKLKHFAADKRQTDRREEGVGEEFANDLI